jgi:sugar phosphate permease
MPLMWQIVAVWFGLSIINKGLDSWMPTYLMTVRGLNLKAVGLCCRCPTSWPACLPPSAAG